MRASRIFVDQPLAEGTTVELGASASHHLSRVLRLKAGAPLVLFNGEGGEYEARIAGGGRRTVAVETIRHVAADRESPLPLRLVLGVSRGERMDFSFQKGVELGAAAFVPVTTERTVVRLDPDRADRRADHWRGVIINACEQSGRTRIPDLAPVTPFGEWLDTGVPDGLKVRLDPRADRGLSSVRYEGGELALLVGPEGGLTDAEGAAARKAGFIGVRLGPRTLRAESAAVVGLAALQARWGDLDSG